MKNKLIGWLLVSPFLATLIGMIGFAIYLGGGTALAAFIAIFFIVLAATKGLDYLL